MAANGTKVRPQVEGVGSAYVEDVTGNGHTLLFRRDQGLWVKRIGPSKARKLCQLPDGSETNGVFSSDGTRVAAFVAADEREQLVAIDVANGRQRDLAEGVDLTEATAPRSGRSSPGSPFAEATRIPGERPKPPESDPSRIRSRWLTSPSAPLSLDTASTR